MDTKMEISQVPSYMQEYSDVIDSLPLELQRSFALLKELDDMLSAQVDNLRTSANDYRAQVASLSTSERMERRRRIRKHTRESIKIAEEKVGLSRSTYDIVDRYVRKLDEDLQRLEDEQIFGGLSLRPALSSEQTQNMPSVRRVGKTLDSVIFPQERQRPSRGRKRGKREAEAPVPTTLPSGIAIKVPTSAAPGDMPIDPNEPRYCYCNQVSFGDMVACDNDDCPLEWFHYACVGLTAPPKGAWFCKVCTAKGQGRDRRR